MTPSASATSAATSRSRGLERLGGVSTLLVTGCREAFAFPAPDVLIVDNTRWGCSSSSTPRSRCSASSAPASSSACATCSTGRRRSAPNGPPTLHRAVDERYDSVWLYLDRNVYDLVRECGLGEAVAERTRYHRLLRHRPRHRAGRTGRRRG